MTARALHRLMSLMRETVIEDYADAFYELVLSSRLLVPNRSGKVAFMTGPNGQIAMPVFLDEAALTAWANPPAQAAPMNAQSAAALALQVPDVWLVVDPGTATGGQPIARKGVELLARGTYPGAERNVAKHEFVSALAAAAAQGVLDPALRERARTTRFYVIGSALPDDAPVGQVVPSGGVQMQGVRGPDGDSYIAAWPTAAGSFEFMPDAPHRSVIAFDSIVKTALHHRRGLVIGIPRVTAQIPAARLAALWGG